jgi:hypothetical protein
MAYTSNEENQGQRMTAKAALREEIYDFSLVLGDPVSRFFRKARLSGDHLELLHRRLITITSIAWVPLLLLDSLSSHAAGIGRLSFLHDVEVQVRFLVALPVLIGAELIVHSRIRPVVWRFVERGIVKEEDLPRFEAVIKRPPGCETPSLSKWRFLSLFTRLDCGSGTADSALTPQPGMRCQAGAGT